MIEFTPDLETKVNTIDTQHKQLFKLINDVVAMGVKAITKEETEATLKALGDYIYKHFRDEELLQQSTSFPKIDWHKEQHKIYEKSFAALKAEYVAKGPSVDFTLRLNESIIKWIVQHIKTADKELGKHILKKEW
jgi:hemerythrin